MGGLFVPWTIRKMDYSYVGLFVRWTFRTMDYSYYGLFVPSVKYSHNINCWCEGLPPGAHPTGCLSNASRPRCSCGVLLLTTSFDEISNASWSLTAAVSFAADIHKSSFDQASIVMASQRCLAVVSAAPTSTALPRS